MQKQFLSTPEAAKQLGVTYWTLISAMRCERVTPPQKDRSGNFIWSPADIARARKALSGKEAVAS